MSRTQQRGRKECPGKQEERQEGDTGGRKCVWKAGVLMGGGGQGPQDLSMRMEGEEVLAAGQGLARSGGNALMGR